MELLRIVAMFLVLIVHCDYYSLGDPTRAELLSAPVPTVARIAFEAVALMCVNLFVFISGWFGITLRRHKLADLLFQVFYFLIGIYAVGLLTGYASLNVEGLKNVLTLSNWFVPVYIVLCILAPALNAFTDSTDRRRFGLILAGLFGVQTVCGWAGSSVTFGHGYTPVCFVSLYLLARYCRKYDVVSAMSTAGWAALFAVCIAANICVGAAVAYIGDYTPVFGAYINPLTIVATVSLTMVFVRLPFTSRPVNFVAKSALAVLLLHTNFVIFPHFADLNREIYARFSGVAVPLVMFAECCGWYAAAVLLDQPRKWLWAKIRL